MTRGFEQPSWWTEFRRCCDRLGIKRLNDRQWEVARQLVRRRQWLSPLQAAQQIARARQ